MKRSIISLSLLLSLPLVSAPQSPQGIPVLSITYDPAPSRPQPYPVSHVIADGFKFGGHIADVLARWTAAQDYRDPAIAYYDNLKQSCENSAQTWRSKKSPYNPIYNADIKNPVHVAGLGLGAAVITLVTIKILNAGIDVAWAGICSMFGKHSNEKK